MDYLNIIATRSLVLFAPQRPAVPHSAKSSSSSHGSSEHDGLLVPPSPIAIPITSIMASDTDLAYFLLQQIFAVQPESTFANSLGTSPGSVDRALRIEGEVLVWREIDKAKRFVRALGEWFAKTGSPNAMPESELKALARGCGLAMKKEVVHDDRLEHISMASHGSEHSAVLA